MQEEIQLLIKTVRFWRTGNVEVFLGGVYLTSLLLTSHKIHDMVDLTMYLLDYSDF